MRADISRLIAAVSGDQRTVIGLIASCAAMAANPGSDRVRPFFLEGQTGAPYAANASYDWESLANGAVTDALPVSITAVAKGPDQIDLSWPSAANHGNRYLVDIQSSA